jgi:hypothetical protein
MLSDALLAFLQNHSGQAYTAAELWSELDWPGRVLPCHVQQALERKLFPEGSVVAHGGLRTEGEFIRAAKGTRWCAMEGAPGGFLTWTPGEGIRGLGEG